MKHFKKPKNGLNIPSIRPEVATGGIETNYNNQNRLAEASIAQVSWSHDGLLLAAAIHNMVAIFDIRKLEKPLHKVVQGAVKRLWAAYLSNTQANFIILKILNNGWNKDWVHEPDHFS